MLPSGPPTLDQIDNAATLLLKFWQAGDKSLRRRTVLSERDPGAYSYRTKLKVLEEEAEREGLNPDTLKKAWRAAEQYTEKEIRRLCALVRQYQVRFGRSHLMRLMSIKERAVRDDLTLKAIAGGWGVTELERAIQAINGPRAHVGKRPKLPTGERRLLVELIALTVRWQRWCKAAGTRLPDEFKGSVEDATRMVTRVEAKVRAQLSRSSPRERKRSRAQKEG